VVTDVADVGLNPFADWPWEQALQFNADLPYKRAGRLMRNMLRWCNQHCSCQIMVMTHESRKAAATLLYESFSGAVDIGDHAQALLIAMQSTAEAGEQMKCILANALRRAVEYPNSPMLVYIAQRRAAQSDELRVFLAECSTRITEESKDKLARPTRKYLRSAQHTSKDKLAHTRRSSTALYAHARQEGPSRRAGPLCARLLSHVSH
jgi:hypothetical protein